MRDHISVVINSEHMAIYYLQMLIKVIKLSVIGGLKRHVHRIWKKILPVVDLLWVHLWVTLRNVAGLKILKM